MHAVSATFQRRYPSWCMLLALGAGVAIGWSTSSWSRRWRQRLLQWLWPMGRLKLDKPLVTFDIESTGTNVSRDRIVEIAALKLMPDGRVITKGPQRLNPGISMSDEVIAIHGITDADLADCPRFHEIAEEWREFLDNCYLHGYNAKKFDVPLLRNEFRRCSILHFPLLGVPVIDSFRIFCQHEPRNLSAAARLYCGYNHDGSDAHSALADAQVTLAVLIEQVRRYTGLPNDAASLAQLCAAPGRAQDITGDGKFQWRGHVPIFAYGKYAGEPLAVVIAHHKDHLRWMSGQDYSDESLIVVAQALKGLLPTKAGGWEPLSFDSSATAASCTGAAAPAAAPAVAMDVEQHSANGALQTGQQQREQRHQQQQARQQNEHQHQLQQQRQLNPCGIGSPAEQQQQQLEPAVPIAAAITNSRSSSSKSSRSRYSKGPAGSQSDTERAVGTPTGWPELAPAEHQNGTQVGPDSWGVSEQSRDEWSSVKPGQKEPENPEPQQTQEEATNSKADGL